MDIVQIVGNILGTIDLDDEEFLRADTNCDGVVDVLDIVNVVNMMIG